MSVPVLTATEFGGAAGAPLLLLGPSLGTSVEALWRPCADLLTGRFRVVGWDLPGHGHSAPAGGFTVADLAAAVLAIADELGADRFHYAGDSVGGVVGMELLAGAPQRVVAATLVCTAARIGTPASWRERAALVRSEGLGSLVAGAPQRWFGPGFAQRSPDRAGALLASHAQADAASYAAACEALAGCDLTGRIAAVSVPVTVAAGGRDAAVPAGDARRVATEARDGRFVLLDEIGHLAPAEAPDRVARLIEAAPRTAREAGMSTRREVLGDDHVERAVAATTEFTEDFQDFITRYAWGEIWGRPGLDRHSRSLITLTALLARGNDEEFALHLGAALRNGVTRAEIAELILQCAVYCGVPAANSAFRIAQRVLEKSPSSADIPATSGLPAE